MSGMVQVVLSLKQETEQKLRRMARELKGGKKGALSAVVTEALDEYEKRAEQLQAIEKLLKKPLPPSACRKRPAAGAY